VSNVAFEPRQPTPALALAEERSFVTKVFAWMSVGLAFTAAIALILGHNASFQDHLSGPVFLALFVVELGLVWYLSARISRLSATTATTLFLVYAGLNGVTLSVVFAIYTSASIGVTFVVCSSMFGVMAAAGWLTSIDLTGLGGFLLMALWGLIAAVFVNLLWANSALYWITTFAGIAIFLGLTAYDVQKIKRIGAAAPGSAEDERRLAIVGALALYLDFINLFLFLLRIFGRR
jgi:FtsH-binding integral membrane protein